MQSLIKVAGVYVNPDAIDCIKAQEGSGTFSEVVLRSGTRIVTTAKPDQLANEVHKQLRSLSQ